MVDTLYATNLSLQYVNFMDCIVIYGIGVHGEGWLYEWPIMHCMLVLNLALQWHLWVL